MAHSYIDRSDHLLGWRADDRDRLVQGPNGDNQSLYDATRRLIENTRFPDADTFSRRVLLELDDQCTALRIPLPHDAILLEMRRVAAMLFVAETFDHVPPNPAQFASENIAAGIGQLRDLLIRQYRKVFNFPATLEVLTGTIVASFFSFTKRLPPIACDGGVVDGVPTIRLIDLLPSFGIALEDMLKPFFRSNEYGVFSWIHGELAQRHGPNTPSNYSGTATELLTKFVGGTPFEYICNAQVPFLLPEETRFSGHWIVAPPGRGKTTLLHTMIVDDLAHQQASVIIMDSKGDLIEPIRRLKHLEDRLIIIDPDPLNPIAINPLDIGRTTLTHSVELLEYLFASLLEFKMTANQSTLFRSVLRALVTAFPNPTLETFRDVLTNGYEPYKQYIEKLPQDLQDFFFKEFNERNYTERRREVIQRLRLLLETR